MSSSNTPGAPEHFRAPTVTDDELPTAESQRPSIATFKNAIDYGINDSIRSVIPVAKYIAAKHPGFVLAPALPSVYDVEFQHRELVNVDGDVEQRTTLAIYYGDGPVQQTLGTVTISRRYRGMPNMSRLLDGSQATDTTVEYSEATTP